MVKFEAKLVHHDLGHTTWLSIESEYYKDIGVQSYSTALGKIQATLNYCNIQKYDTPTEKISKILDFINEYVGYQEELDNIIRSPVETLSLGSGDDEEYATLAAALFKSVGIDTAIALLKNVDDLEYSMVLVHLEKLNITNYYYEKPYHIFQDLTKHGLKPGPWILVDTQTRIRFQGSPEIDEYLIKAAVEIENIMS